MPKSQLINFIYRLGFGFLVSCFLVMESPNAYTFKATDDDTHKQILATIQEYQYRCQSPKWQIWDHTLCGPLLFVDPQTRKLYASDADKQGLLKKQNELFTGLLPATETIANTAKEWAGVHWSMIMLPLPEGIEQQMSLLAHESWHRIQSDLGLPLTTTNNSHLSQLKGRYLLLLELRALATVLQEEGPRAEQSLVDALTFREHRYQIYPKAREQELLLEVNEGLAEYTGIVLNQNAEIITNLTNRMVHANKRSSLERSFAYLTGPAYGLLIDHYLNQQNYSRWLKKVDSEFSFNKTLQTRLNIDIKPVNEIQVTKLAEKYDGAKLWQKEKAHFERVKQQKQRFVRQLIKGKTLTIPLQQMQMSFDPNKVISLGPHGKVYQQITIIDHWGKIEASSGLLIASDFSHIKVDASQLILSDASKNVITSAGWKLSINNGWRLEMKDNLARLILKN